MTTSVNTETKKTDVRNSDWQQVLNFGIVDNTTTVVAVQNTASSFVVMP